MIKKIYKKANKGIDTAITLTCSLALSAYIVYYAIFKYKGQSTTDKKEHRS